jgi:hypothetical protein
MRHILIVLLSIISISIGSAQIKLTQVEKDTIQFRVPVAHRVIPGQSGYFLKYMTAPALFDSLGIELYDSIYVVTGVIKDTIKLRDGDGYALVDKGVSLNGQTGITQTFATTNNNDNFTITSTGNTHTFNMPYQNNSTGLRLGVNAKLLTNSLAVGYNALGSSLGSNNTALGTDVLRLAGSTGVGGTNNVGVGFQALYSTTSGFDNFGMGNYALYYNTSGAYNTAIGTSALLNLNNGSHNVAIGRLSGQNVTGSENTMIGMFTGRASTSISYNTFLGAYAGEAAGGLENTMIGYAAGRYASSNYSVHIGEFSGYTNTRNHSLFIDNNTGTPLIGGQFDNNRVGINTDVASIARALHVTGEVRITDLVTDSPTKLVGADNDGDLGSGYSWKWIKY